jgi:hypothetical protein
MMADNEFNHWFNQIDAIMMQLLLGNDGGDDADGGDEDMFVYTGGDQEIPRDVKRVRIAENIDTIPASTFEDCRKLIEVEGHNKVKKIEEFAFNRCPRLQRMTKTTGVVEIQEGAFDSCYALSELAFDKLEIIGRGAFYGCNSLRSINMPSIRRLRKYAFAYCTALTDAVFGKDLERIEKGAFLFSVNTALRRIVIPLKDNLMISNNAFIYCPNLSRVDAHDGIHKTISSLHMESWRVEMEEEIDRINPLPKLRFGETRTQAIKEWITRVLQRMEHYKSEHKMLLKEAMTLLELALWKAKLLNETDERKCNVDVTTIKTNIDAEAARKEHRVTCGASIVIKNVLPFLALQ